MSGNSVPTMSEVAELAGVSTTTVSHVVNGTRKVSPPTRQRVEEAILASGYRPDAMGRALATGRTRTIGIALSIADNPFFVQLMGAMEQILDSLGFLPLFLDTHDDAETADRVVNALLERRVEGIVLVPASNSDAQDLGWAMSTNVPIVIGDRKLDLDCDQVHSENIQSSRAIATHILDHGHTDIAVVKGLAGLSSTEERFRGCEEAFADRGVTMNQDFVIACEHRTDEVEARVRELFSRPGRPSACISLSNKMTIGVLRGLKDLGLRVPDDVALVVYDDFEWSDVFEPRLTAIAQDMEETARVIADLLVGRIDGERGAPQLVEVPTHFHQGDSCGCVAEDVTVATGTAGATTPSPS